MDQSSAECLSDRLPVSTDAGFRFVQVWGLAEVGIVPTEETLLQHFVHTDVAEVGKVQLPAMTASPDGTTDILNRVQHATLYAQRSNLYSIPTDCPQRTSQAILQLLVIVRSSLTDCL